MAELMLVLAEAPGDKCISIAAKPQAKPIGSIKAEIEHCVAQVTAGKESLVWLSLLPSLCQGW